MKVADLKTKKKIDFAKIYDDPDVAAKIKEIIKKNSCDCPRCRMFYYDKHSKPVEKDQKENEPI